MIWATVRSCCCLCWLNRASPYLAAKNIINLISVLTIWWCVESSLALLEVGVCYDLLGKTLLSFVFLHFVLQHQTCLLLQMPPDFLLFHSSPLWWKGHPFLVLVLEGLVGLHRTAQLWLLQHYWLGHILGLLWYWMVCLGNRDHSVVFETVSKYCISDCFVDYDDYISSKGFLPTVVNIMVLWVKFTHSSPFWFIDS